VGLAALRHCEDAKVRAEILNNLIEEETDAALICRRRSQSPALF
jgi:hypothetical protein